MTKLVTFDGPRSETAYIPYRMPGEPSGFLPGEKEAMQVGVRLSGLFDILRVARPHNSPFELKFLKDYLLPAIRGAGYAPDIDGFGNIWVSVPGHQGGDLGPNFLWSCHVDTVDAKGEEKGVRFQSDGRTIELSKKKPGRCLGADDGAGLWLLLEMLRADIPGGYVFHRGEEKGRLGSEYVAKHEPERLKPYDACVAFDRRDYADFITHQMGMRCASENFAKGMSAALNLAGGEGMAYRPDDGGSYTDSYSYAEIISECANVSVGYDREHGPNETLDALHLWRLRSALLSADFANVVCERDPSEMDYGWGDYPGSLYGGYSGNWGSSGSGSRTGANAWRGSLTTPDEEEALDKRGTLVSLIQRYPRAVADLLGTYGLGSDELLEHMTDNEIAGAVPLVAGIGGGWAND